MAWSLMLWNFTDFPGFRGQPPCIAAIRTVNLVVN